MANENQNAKQDEMNLLSAQQARFESYRAALHFRLMIIIIILVFLSLLDVYRSYYTTQVFTACVQTRGEK